jgi:uncharacterized delta-60 repeat protein
MFNILRRKNRSSSNQPCTVFRPRLEALDDRCLPSGGVLDPTFGTSGLVSSTAGGFEALAVATESDGKVVVAGTAGVSQRGTSYPEFAVARFNLDGTLDTSFGGTGEVTTILTTLKRGGWARDVAIQPDGKIVAAGQAFSGFALVRYNADGTLDKTFGSNSTGIVVTSIGRNTFDAAYRLGLEPDGKIVVAGTSDGIVAVARYTSSGVLDTSFGTGGKVTTQLSYPLDFGGPTATWMDLALDVSPLDPNAGKIVVTTRVSATTGLADVVVRYNANGSLDKSFAAGAGYETLSNLTNIPSVAIQSDGRIILAGINNHALGWPMELDRLNPDGSFDNTFGSGGIVVVTPPANAIYSVNDVALQSDGKIVVGGTDSNTVTSELDFLLARLNSADGSVDTSFGAGGVAHTSGLQIGGSSGEVAFEPDGRIVVAGMLPGGVGIALARFLAAGPQIGSFTASPNPVTAGSSLTLSASSVTDANPNSTITQVAFYVDNNNDGILEPGADTLLGYATQTSPGVWTFTFTVNLSPGTYTLFAQAEDSYGVFGDPVSLALTVQ